MTHLIGRSYTEALNYIRTVRVVVYKKHHLATGQKSSKSEDRRAKIEKDRRDAARSLYKDLSQYYRKKDTEMGYDTEDEETDGKNEGDVAMWTRPRLLKEGKLVFSRSSHERNSADLHSPQCWRTSRFATPLRDLLRNGVLGIRPKRTNHFISVLQIC